MSDRPYKPEEFRLANEPEGEMERAHLLEYRLVIRRHGRRTKVIESASKTVRRALELAFHGDLVSLEFIKREEVPASE